MKRKPDPQKKYKKELFTLLQQKKVKRDDLQQIIDDICEGKPLDKRYDDHPMVKTSPKHYQGYRIFHYKGNICVIYKIHPDRVELLRIGNHSDLGLTENFNKKVRA